MYPRQYVLPDPDRHGLTLVKASLLWVRIDDANSCYLADATPRQLDMIRSSKGRHPSLQAAKKTLRIGSLLDELDHDLDSLPTAAPTTKAPLKAASAAAIGQKSAPPSTTAPSRTSLAIVPFVDTVPPDTLPRGGSDFFAAALSKFANSGTLRHVCWALNRLLLFISYLPIIFFYVCFFYSAAAFFYLLANPLLNYAAYAADVMLSQAQVELAARFR